MQMAGVSYLFPAIYSMFLLPLLFGWPGAIKVALALVCLCAALVINARFIRRIVILLLVGACTLIPFLALVQSAICSSEATTVGQTFERCVIGRSTGVLSNIALLSSAFLLAAANEWRGSGLATFNGMRLPRSVRIMAIVAAAMIGEFRRAMTKVHQAFTARGEATARLTLGNFVMLAPMLGVVWASVLDGLVDRLRGQWSSERFWDRFVPVRASESRCAASDLTVLGIGALTLGLMFWHPSL